MAILIDRNSRVMTQGITGKTGQFHTRMCRDYAFGKNCFVAGVNPKKGGEDFDGVPIFATVREAKEVTGATVSVIASCHGQRFSVSRWVSPSSTAVAVTHSSSTAPPAAPSRSDNTWTSDVSKLLGMRPRRKLRTRW